jgi:hypothetical protein
MIHGEVNNALEVIQDAVAELGRDGAWRADCRAALGIGPDDKIVPAIEKLKEALEDSRAAPDEHAAIAADALRVLGVPDWDTETSARERVEELLAAEAKARQIETLETGMVALRDALAKLEEKHGLMTARFDRLLAENVAIRNLVHPRDSETTAEATVRVIDGWAKMARDNARRETIEVNWGFRDVKQALGAGPDEHLLDAAKRVVRCWNEVAEKLEIANRENDALERNYQTQCGRANALQRERDEANRELEAFRVAAKGARNELSRIV